MSIKSITKINNYNLDALCGCSVDIFFHFNKRVSEVFTLCGNKFIRTGGIKVTFVLCSFYSDVLEKIGFMQFKGIDIFTPQDKPNGSSCVSYDDILFFGFA